MKKKHLTKKRGEEKTSGGDIKGRNEKGGDASTKPWGYIGRENVGLPSEEEGVNHKFNVPKGQYGKDREEREGITIVPSGGKRRST